MLNPLISCDDPMERLLYGEPDSWLAQFECRHNHVPDMDGDGRITFVDEIAYEIQQQAQADPEGFLSSSGGGRDEDGFFFTQDDGSRQYVDPDSGAPGTATDNDLDETDDLDRPRTRTERDVDAFLAQPAELAFDGDAEGWGLTSQDAFRADSERETPSRTEEEGDGEHDAVEALIVARGRALGLSEAQIARAITRYRASAVPLRAAAASRGLTNAATDPATALLGAGAHGDNTPSPASANPAERITRAGGSGAVLGAAEGDRDSRSAGLDGFGETRDVPTINPAYTEWEERNKIPLYLKADGEPLAPNELSVRGWYPAKETYPEFAARHGVDVVLNPNYVEPGERPNQYLDGSGQPVPETWEQAVAAYERDAEPLRRDAGQYETEAATYRTDFDAYEAAVNAWNENPGSAAELKALQDRRERLTTEQARLSASADAINARAQARQADAQNLNDLARLEPSERNRVIRTTAGPPELRETRYQEALDAHNDRRRVPRPMSEDANGEYIENYWSKYKAWESANNSAAIELALTAVASGRPVPDRLMVGGTYRTASLSDAATPVEVAQTVREWRADEDWAEKADDDPDGGGGGGSSRECTVADGGTVSYTQGDHTYTVSDDDLAQDVREAATTGDASGLTGTQAQVSVSDGSGNVVAANFQAPEPADGGAAATPAAEIAEIQAYHAALLASADELGIGYDDRHPDFEQIRADVQERADQQNRDYVNYFLGADTVSQETAPTQEQIEQASEVAADVGSLGRTSAPSQDRVAADIGAQNREYVNFYLPGTVPEGTAPTQEQIEQASEVAADVGSLGRTSAPSQARVAADIGAQNREYVNFYLPGTVPEGTAPTQEQIEQASEVADDVASLGRTSAPSQARVAADIGAQNREYVNFYLPGTVPEGTAPTQEQIEQASEVADDVASLGRTSAPSQARVAADIGAQNREYVNFYLPGTVPEGTAPTQEQTEQAIEQQQRAADERMALDLGLPADTSPEGVQQAARARAEEIEQGFRDSVLDTAPAPGSFVSSVLGSQIDAGGLPRNHPDFPEYDRIRTALDGPHWRREQIADSTQQLLEDTTVGSLDVGPAWDAFRAIGTGRHVSQFDSSVPIDANLGLVPVAGTLADLNVRGRDGYSKGDIAWIAGMGALDVVPIPLAKGGRLLVAAPKLARGGILGDAVTGTRNILGAGTGRPSFVNINRLTEPGPGMIQPTRYYTAAPDAPRIHQGTVDQQFAAERFRNLGAFTERYPDGPPPDVPLPDTSRDLMNWKALERRLDPAPLHLDTVALEKSVGRTGWPLGIDIGEGSIRTTEPSILARRRPGHFSASPVDLSKPGRTGQLIQEPYFVDAAGNVRPVATSPWGGLWTTASHAAVEWSDRTSGGIPGDSHNVFHIVNPKADVTQALAGSQKISRTVWDEQELRLIEADRGVLPAVTHERPLIGDPTMIDVYGARKLSPETDATLLEQFRENWTPRKKRRDPIGYQNALSDLRAERFKLPSRMADVLGIHRATYRSDEPISWLDAQRLNLEVMRSKLPGVTHRAGSDVTWNTEAPVVRLTGDQPQKLQSWLETNTTADYRPNRQAVNHAVSAQSDADRIFRQLEYLAADSTDPAVRQARIEHLRQHISYLDSVDPGLRNPRSGFKRDLELSRANTRLDDIMAPDAQETIAGLRAQHDQAAVKATEARNALDRTIAPDGTDLLGEYSPPSVRRYHQNAQPKALNWVVRNNSETGSIEVLMLRRGYGSEKGLNTPPGGIQDARMTGRETAVEEALEEAGLYTNPVFELTTPIGYNQTSVVSVVDFGAPVKVQRSEVQGYSWMPLDEVTPSNVAYPEYAMPQIRQLQQWAKTQTPDQFAAAATANGNSPRPRPDFSSDKPPDDGFGTVDVSDYGEELAEYGYRGTTDGLPVPVPVGQPIGALQGYPTELQRSHADADSQKNTESLFDDNGDGPGASLRPLDSDSAPSRTILAGGEHGGLKGTPYAPPTRPGDTPYAPPTRPGDTPTLHRPRLGTRPTLHRPGLGTRPTLHRPGLGIRPTLHRPRLGIRPTLHRPRLGIRPTLHRPRLGYALRSTDHAWGYALRSTDHAWGYALRSTDHAWGYALRSATHTTICPRHPGLSWSTRSHWQDKSPRSRRSG